MKKEEPESEAVRMKRDVTTARRSFIIIFGVGIAGTVTAILLVLKNRPAGDLENGYGKAVPTLAPRLPPCKKFGDSCELSPGKLGTCIQKERCEGEHCLFCQSQH
ncbi:MAG TPA: hypothetical protein VHC69_31035 [Polyangiaceae bacterium]|nr:hypothetical protein [Polyangiaceae bacterium]